MCKTFVCTIIAVDIEDNPIFPRPILIYLRLVIGSGVLALLMNVATYVQVYKQSKKVFIQIKDMSPELANQALQKEKRLGKMVVLMTLSFILVYVPIIIANAMDVKNVMVWIVSYSCSYLLVLLDPLIYIYSHEKYQTEIKLILKSIPSLVTGPSGK